MTDRPTYHIEHIRLGDVRVGDVVLMPARRGSPAWRTVRCLDWNDKFTTAWDDEKGAADAARGSHIHWTITGYNETLVELQVQDEEGR